MRLKRMCKKTPYRLIGGPYSVGVVYLTTPSTMVMSVNGWHGRYVKGHGEELVWEDLK